MIPKKQKRLFRILLLVIMALVFANLKGSEASGIGKRASNFVAIPGALPDFDIRDDIRVNIQPTEAQTESLSNLENKSVSWNERWGVPKVVINYGGYLTDDASGEAEEVARNFLGENQVLFGLSGAEVNSLSIQRTYETAHNGATHFVFSQTDNGRSLYRSQIKVTVDNVGRIVIVGGT
ncbi:MAG: hypothetical protein GWN30_32345, partial [Gammaproteobacteria bacterium]|nr:hypothetical protein [Gammaproteobacteria bacterium]